MAAHVRFEGLEELRAALRALPATLVGEATGLVQAAAESAKADIVAAYPRRTGNLRDHVQVTTPIASAAGVVVVLRNTSKEARYFEHGSQVRHTAIGANRGSMPPGHVFEPRYQKWRRHMWDTLADLLRREGLSVSGTP
jgi:hypothetical protein